MADDDDTDLRQLKMLETNARQKEYYEETSAGWISPVNSFATNLWSRLRHRAMVAVSDEQREQVYEVHRDWLGDLEGCKVLDLGAGAGSPLSGWLAENAGAYDAVELSEMQLDILKDNIGDGPNRRFIAADFLDPEATDDDYDVIYAHAVLHHFEFIDVALDIVRDKLKPGGKLVTYDPLQTWLPIRIFRALFRPFQTDADWEFPLTGRAMSQIEARFRVVSRLGVFNRGKWALILGVLSPRLGQRYGDALFSADFDGQERGVRSSLHLSHLLRRP